MVDTDRLPQRVLADSTIFVSAYLRRDEFTEDSAAFLEAMEQQDRTVLIAAPTIAELLRGEPSMPPPRRKAFEMVAFDDVAAMILGKDFPTHVLVAKKDSLQRAYNYIKYDAMIVACAKRGRADCIVSTDSGVSALAAAIGLPCYGPRYFRTPQLRLPNIKG